MGGGSWHTGTYIHSDSLSSSRSLMCFLSRPSGLPCSHTGRDRSTGFLTGVSSSQSKNSSSSEFASSSSDWADLTLPLSLLSLACLRSMQQLISCSFWWNRLYEWSGVSRGSPGIGDPVSHLQGCCTFDR